MGKTTRIDYFFKKKFVDNSDASANSPSTIEISSPPDERPSKLIKLMPKEIDISSLERDPGLRPQIWEYPVNQQDEIRRQYLKFGPSQCILKEYPLSEGNHPRRFQASWFMMHPSWLEYSPTKDATFCLHCYLFNKPGGRSNVSAFRVEGFRNWKKVNDGKNCAFLTHVGKDPNYIHRIAVKSCEDLQKIPQHIGRVYEKKDAKEIAGNRLRLKTTVDAIRWLTVQACAFRGRDESHDSINRGNFIQFVKILASYNEEVEKVVLDKAPKNDTYTLPKIQKEVLHILSSNVKKVIREEIGDAKFCIIVDEARDESKKEQMAIVLRFVDKEGSLCERFFGVVHVSDTTAATLKYEICRTLSRHNLNIEDIRGQGYDGASNMRGEWNGLQALVCQESPYAYYVHCFAHRLRLALVATSREVKLVHQFFSKLNFIVNAVGSSCKRNDQLKAAQAAEIAHLLEINEIESGTGLNQIGTLQRAGDTHWGSHFGSICSLIKMFNATFVVLDDISEYGTTYIQRGDADSALTDLKSFEFVLVLHMMKDTMEITDILCQALQNQGQDIINALHLVSSTKELLQKLRDGGWTSFFGKVISFCEQRGISIPDMNAPFTKKRGRSCDNITMEHHYRIDIFYGAIDSQMQELNNRSNENTIKLLILNTALDPGDGFKSFDADKVYELADKLYPQDFTEQEKVYLRLQLHHYQVDLPQHADFQNLKTISELCRGLAKTRKSTVYHLVDRLLRLVLTLPVSTATTERAFSAMKIVKTKLRNKMEDEFLADYIMVYIEREIAEKFSTDFIIDEFDSLKERRVPLR